MRQVNFHNTGPCARPRVDAQHSPPNTAAFGRLLGHSREIGQVRAGVRAVAARRCTVLIVGETGTGKELVARHLHDLGDRSAGPFVAVDCSALSESLFESQMFGHVRGSFTGATRDALGFIRAAHGGTLFLDEIGELSLAHQAKLLRVIQERCVTPVGENRPTPVDVRVVCATHRNLEAMVASGAFREDLFFRLAVVTLSVPPLRERGGGDVLALAEHFLTAQAALYGEGTRQLSDEARAALQVHAWPGNVRELANAMEHAHVMSQGPVVALSDLPARLAAAIALSAGRIAGAAISELSLEVVERRTIAEALTRARGNKTAAGRLLGINVQRLNRRIEKLGLNAT